MSSQFPIINHLQYTIALDNQNEYRALMTTNLNTKNIRLVQNHLPLKYNLNNHYDNFKITLLSSRKLKNNILYHLLILTYKEQSTFIVFGYQYNNKIYINFTTNPETDNLYNHLYMYPYVSRPFTLNCDIVMKPLEVNTNRNKYVIIYNMADIVIDYIYNNNIIRNDDTN
jgi:hypothetical protein